MEVDSDLVNGRASSNYLRIEIKSETSKDRGSCIRFHSIDPSENNMATAEKKRRKIIVGERRFLWYVAEDVDGFPPTVDGNLYALNIVSEDKRFIVRYHLGQSDSERRHITVIGPEFGNRTNPGCWRRYLCPHWSSDRGVAPAMVREIIEWCLGTRLRTAVDHAGLPLERTGNGE